MYGLSPEGLRILLHPMPDMGDKEGQTTEGDTPAVENEGEGNSLDEMMKDYDGSEDVVLWDAKDLTMGNWRQGQVVYTFDKKHTVGTYLFFLGGSCC